MEESNRESPLPERALVLSGGGARGAYQVGVIKYLHDAGWKPDMVCGTSIGAVNAAVYGSGVPVDRMADLWFVYDRKKLKRFSLRGLLNSLKHNETYNPPADTRGMRAAIEKHIDFGALRQSDTRVFISALNMKTGQVRYFTNTVIGVSHVMAAAAIPMVFPWQYIDGIPYWDAGLMANTPVAPALGLKAREIVVVLHSPVGAFETGEPKTKGEAFELAVEHMLAGSFTMLLPDNSWEHAPDADVFETPLHGSPKLTLSLKGTTLRVVAPPKMLGIRSMFNYSPEQAKALIDQGYMDARMQLDI